MNSAQPNRSEWGNYSGPGDSWSGITRAPDLVFFLSTENRIAHQSYPPTDDQMTIIEAKEIMRKAIEHCPAHISAELAKFIETA